MVVASDQRVNATVFSELDQVVVAGIGGHNPGRVVRIRQPDRLLLEAPAEFINLISDFRHKFKWSAVSRATSESQWSAARAVNPARDIKMAASPAQRAKASGAGDGDRTRYLNLGKVALCQMSYSRVICLSDLKAYRSRFPPRLPPEEPSR